MDSLFDAMKSAAAAQAAQLGVNRWGTVTSVRMTDQGYEVKVSYDYGQDDVIPTGWMPVLSTMGVGPGWGAVSPPFQGMQAFVAPDHGDGNHGVVLGLAYSIKAMPPQPAAEIGGDQKPVEQGEIAFVSKAGAIVRLCADGTVFIKTATLNVDADDVNVRGNLTVQQGNIVAQQGSITAQANDVSDQHGSLNRLRGNYDQHRHTGVQTGLGISGLTDHSDPE